MIRFRFRTVLVAALAAGGIALALPYLLIGGAVSYEASGEYLARTSFDREAWRDSARVYSANPVRSRMVHDLLRRHDLKGMTRAEVVSLLGDPDSTLYLREWDMVYWLGPERGIFGIDSEWLGLRLGRHGRVIMHQVVTD